MDAGNWDKVETDKGSEECMNYHTVAHSDYGATFVNLLMGVAPDCKGDLVSASPFVSMADSFCSAPALWDHHPANSQSMGFNSINGHNNTFDKLAIFNPTSSGPIRHSMSQFPADSAFIERAARFSCFSTGDITDMVNSFGVNQPINPYHQAGMMLSQDSQKSELNPASADLSPKMPFEMKNGGAGSDTGNSGGQEEASLIDTGAQSYPAKRNSTKRKRGAKNTEQTQMPMGEDVKDNGKPNSEPPKNGENGKQSSQTSDPPKEEYIHIRARRGQATNSHSLAERARREKISERMKFLQDLVPGCSKVTGKAAMLDEIINYVQSLQQQVEFLSMKLTTLNHRVDFNDHMFAARPVPPTIGFSTDIPVGYQQLHPSQPTVFHPNHPVMSSQFSGISQVYKDRTSQVHNLWDDELHKVVQMGFNSNSSPENQDTNSTPPAKPKVEL